MSEYKKKILKVDDKIIHRISKYDAQAFEQLYNQVSGAVYGLAMSILANQSDAEDVVQETFISIYNNAKNYSGRNKAMAWIFTIARNHSLMKIRERQKNVHTDLDQVYDVGVEEHTDEQMYKEQLIDVLLDSLQEDERQIVVMHSMSNMKHKEIAKIMNIPLSTTLSKYRRALEKLKKEMEVRGYEK